MTSKFASIYQWTRLQLAGTSDSGLQEVRVTHAKSTGSIQNNNTRFVMVEVHIGIYRTIQVALHYAQGPDTDNP